MKRKDLYNYIREEIINELSETTYAGKDSVSKIQKDPKFNALKPDAKTNAISDLKTGGDVELEEMARKGSNIKVGENFSTIKDVYAGSMIERILNAVEEAGEEGITPKNIQTAVGIKASSQLNPIMRELMELGAIVGPAPKEAEAEPEEVTPEDDLASIGVPKVVANPDEEEEVEKDEWESGSEEEEGPDEEEPKDIKAADKEAEKVVGGKSYAQKLSPEDEEKYAKLKKGIEAKVARLMDMTKAKREASDEIKILRLLINKDDVKKLFKAKGVNIKDLTSDIF